MAVTIPAAQLDVLINQAHEVWLSVHAACGVTNPQKINVSGMYLVAGVNPAGQYDPNR